MREVDEALLRFLRGVPMFFLPDSAGSQRPAAVGSERQDLVLQRHELTLLIHGQWCRLHLPYLARGTAEPTCGSSKDAALDGARLIITAETGLRDRGYSFTAGRFQLGRSRTATSWLWRSW